MRSRLAALLLACGCCVGALGAVESRAQSTVGSKFFFSAAAPTSRTQMATIVRAWSKRLNNRDNAGIAELFALPAIIVQAPYEYKLRTRHQVALWFSLLPCSGTIESISYKGSSATAVFLLGNRGATRCDGPGTLAAATFFFSGGKISAWEQVPVPARKGGSAA
jgi:hypothetical protein